MLVVILIALLVLIMIPEILEAIIYVALALFLVMLIAFVLNAFGLNLVLAGIVGIIMTMLALS